MMRRLWERSATYRPALLRRERWALLCEVLPEAAALASVDTLPVSCRAET